MNVIFVIFNSYVIICTRKAFFKGCSLRCYIEQKKIQLQLFSAFPEFSLFIKYQILQLNTYHFQPSVKYITSYDFFAVFNREIRVIGVKVQQFHSAKISQWINHWRAYTHCLPLYLSFPSLSIYVQYLQIDGCRCISI